MLKAPTSGRKPGVAYARISVIWPGPFPGTGFGNHSLRDYPFSALVSFAASYHFRDLNALLVHIFAQAINKLVLEGISLYPCRVAVTLPTP